MTCCWVGVPMCLRDDIAALLTEEGPMGSAEIARRLGKLPQVVKRALKDAPGFRICTWQATRTYPRPLYTLGDDPDAVRPKPATQAERSLQGRSRRAQIDAREAELKLAACQVRVNVDHREAALRFDPWVNMLRGLK